MNQKTLKTKLVFLLALAFLFSGYTEADAQRRRGKKKKTKAVEVAKTPPNISYTVSMSKPWTHLLEVEMEMNWAQMPEKAEVKMPVWTPGSYLVREYARHVQSFVALDSNGNALDWRKINKNTWQIDTKGAKAIRIGYYVYSNDLTVRTNELNYEHAFFTPAALLMFPKGQIKAPSTVRVRPYRNWKVATGLKPVSGQPNTFRAENYDILYDSPFEVSDFKELKFTVRGKPHRYVVTGEGNLDLQRIADDTAKMIEECYKLFGDLPYDDYTFILNLRGGGGLEHLNSTALQWNKFGFQPESRYTAFLSLVAHEFFHLWNVKRIRPDALGPFDYENENYTRLLWVAEGTTSYYEGVLMRRAGLVKANYILDAKANIAGGLYRQPGRFQTSLEEASFDAWIKSYRPDENSVNRQISYYSKGELVNFLLDILIRTNSGGAKSLDDVMRFLNEEFHKKNKNFTPEDFQKASEMMAGTSLDGFFKKYIGGKEEIEYDQILNQIGLKMISRIPESDKAYLGGNLSESNGRLRFTSVPANTPAYENGLNADDQILAIDGFRASRQFLNFYLGSKSAGEKVKLAIFRHDKLMEMDVTLGKTPASRYKIVPVDNPTEDQKRLYKQFVDEDLN